MDYQIPQDWVVEIGGFIEGKLAILMIISISRMITN